MKTETCLILDMVQHTTVLGTFKIRSRQGHLGFDFLLTFLVSYVSTSMAARESESRRELWAILIVDV